MKPNRLMGLGLFALFALLAGCGGGGGGSAPAAGSNAAPIALQSPDAAPIVTTNPPAVTLPPSNAPALVAQSGAINATNSCGLANFQADVFRAINAARAQARSCGGQANPATAAVAWNDTLLAAATAHSQDMAQRNYFSHTTPEGATPGDRAQAAGYAYRALGENIAAGQRTVADVMQGWIASPGHCSNIMNPVYTEVAVACVSTSRTMYPTYWTMVLGKP